MKMIKFLFIFILISIPNLVIAKMRIKLIKGKVTVNKTIKFNDKFKLKEGDTLRLRRNSVVILALDNESTFKISGPAIVEIKSANEPISDANPFHLFLHKGNILLSTKSEGKLISPYKIETPGPTFTLNQSLAFIGIDNSQIKFNEIWAAVKSGSPMTATIRNQKIEIPQEHSVVFAKGMKFDTPYTENWPKSLTWEMGPEPTNFYNDRYLEKRLKEFKERQDQIALEKDQNKKAKSFLIEDKKVINAKLDKIMQEETAKEESKKQLELLESQKRRAQYEKRLSERIKKNLETKKNNNALPEPIQEDGDEVINLIVD